MSEIALTECHEKANSLYAFNVEGERFKLLMVEQVHILFANALEVVNALYLHRLGLDPLAILNVASLGGNFADVYFWVEICCERIAVVAAVAVKNVNVVDLVKLMLHCVSGEHSCNTGIKAASEQSGDTCFFKFLTVCPLPLVFELCCVERLIVCGVNIVSLCSKAGVHYREILIGECEIEHNIGLVALNECDKLVNVVGIYLRCLDNRLGGGLEFLLERVTLGFGAARYHDPLKNFAVLAALVDSNGSNSAATDDHTFFHIPNLLFIGERSFIVLVSSRHCEQHFADHLAGNSGGNSTLVVNRT